MTKALKSVSIAILGFFIVLSGGWFYVKNEFETQIKHGVFNLNQKGHKAKYESLTVGGYPLSIKGTLKTVSFAQSQSNNGVGVTLSADSVHFHSSLFSPLTPKFVVEKQQLKVIDEKAQSFTIQTPKVEGVAHLTTAGRIKEGEVRAVDVSVTSAGGDVTTAREFKAELRSVRNEANKKQKDLSLVSSLKNVQLTVNSPFKENKILMLYLDAILSNTDVLPVTKVDLSSWRDANGTMHVRTLSLKSENISAHASGDLRVDAAFRPEGKLSIKTPVLNELVNVLSFYGTLSPDASKTLKFMQGFSMAIPQSKDNSLSLSLKAHDGQLTMGGIPLSTLKPLV